MKNVISCIEIIQHFVVFDVKKNFPSMSIFLSLSLNTFVVNCEREVDSEIYPGIDISERSANPLARESSV